jgi:hypothetical protein
MMTGFGKYLTTALVAGGLAGPAAAQYPYPPSYPSPQNYPPGYGYPQQQYGYGNQGGIGQIIDQLLGNRYNVNDRSAVSRCASAAVAQVQARYQQNGYNQGYNQQGYNQGYGYQGQGQGYQGQGQGYAYGQGYNRIRVTAITSVERRSNGLRVRGLLDTGRGNGGYGNQGYGNQGYASGDLTFRCNVDYRGYVSDVRIDRNNNYRRY